MGELPPAAGALGSGNEQGGHDAACCVLHVDMDSFFASVEVLDEPSLAGLPVVVGGTGARGVVASCTYEARAFGVHSAMPSGEAHRLCPQAVFVDGRYWRYSEVSEQLHEVLRSFTPVIEGIGLDEAFLDVTGVRRLSGSPTAIAAAIRETVHSQLSLSCSVGVARSKLLAKLASRRETEGDGGRPRDGPGVFVVLPDDEWPFLEPLPVRALWGVGPATARRLEQIGVRTVGALAAVPEGALRHTFGVAQGRALALMGQGRDDRVVEADRPLKSVGHEETFSTDIADLVALGTHVVRMADAVAHRLHVGCLAGRTVTLKVRYPDRVTFTRSHTVARPIDGGRALAAIACALLDGVDVTQGVRLLGVSVTGLSPSGRVQATQLAFDLGGTAAQAGEGSAHDRIERPAGAGHGGLRAGSPRAQVGGRDQGGMAAEDRSGAWEHVEAAVAAIRARYGHRSVGPAVLTGAGGLRVKGKGDTQWGPSVAQDRAAGVGVDPDAPVEGP